ncbi:pimeloyl-ACP methyl ester carboxylesterase [Pseudarthrobacter defluvii]|uniref:Pimeloyl-ACP methyl ester carboxylesterase n=2 Tax=Pseudarthrobacter defluvii TaxID=410837 RepID=A0ABT9UMX2_9MICC|nr:pimeloyl-ACP methyl ester carboxylesterase [Pseudarthrobacter defluvii]
MTMTKREPDQPSRHLTRPEGRIAYDIRGAGPLVLLVPGMGDLRSTYRFLTPALVASGYQVVTVDLRGHGDSETSFSAYGDVPTASDLAALLADLGKPAVVVGNSMAAGAAVIVAAEHPDLIEGLVLVGPFVRQPASAGLFSRLFLRLLMAPLWAARVWSLYMPKLYAGQLPPDFADYRRTVASSIGRPGYARAFSLTTRTDHVQAGASLDRVHSPALVVMGCKDPDFPDPRAECEWIARKLGGRAVMIDDAGHYPQSQQPEHLAGVVLDFLAEVRDRA